jgi:hypothetical protein
MYNWLYYNLPGKKSHTPDRWKKLNDTFGEGWEADFGKEARESHLEAKWDARLVKVKAGFLLGRKADLPSKDTEDLSTSFLTFYTFIQTERLTDLLIDSTDRPTTGIQFAHLVGNEYTNLGESLQQTARFVRVIATFTPHIWIESIEIGWQCMARRRGRGWPRFPVNLLLLTEVDTSAAPRREPPRRRRRRGATCGL